MHRNAVKFRFFRIMPPEKDELRIQPVLRIVPGLVRAIHKRRCVADARGTVGIIVIQKTTI